MDKTSNIIIWRAKQLALQLQLMDSAVKVAARCRPLSSKEVNRGSQCIISMTDTTVRVSSTADEAPREFTFDHCYFLDSTQDQVFNDLGHPLLVQALEGFNGTIFAYGQTGSGKSFSMTGDDAMPGIVPRLNNNLWEMIEQKLLQLSAASASGTDQSKESTKFMITVSFLEIYNEVIKDLLNPADKPLKIRENPASGIYVEGLCELIVRDSADLNRLIDQGNAVRRVAATNMNETSSRSHSCFTIKVEKKTVTDLANGMRREQMVRAKLNLVDLAGSERADKTGATGATLKEGANINMSLMSLGNVINALAEVSKGVKKHIPYRDSKLTRLLQESLGGNSLTVMLAAISPADYNMDETVSTLKYANRAKSISNAVSRNEDSTEGMIRDLKDQIEQLKQQLQHGSGGPEAESRLREMEESQKNAWDERERLSRELEAERQANMNTVINDMMKNVKDQKVNHMKRIKRLNNEKIQLTKQYKDRKELASHIKPRLNENTVKYQTQLTDYDEMMSNKDSKSIDNEVVESIVSSMSDCLNKIETDRKLWLENQEEAIKIKERLEMIEEEITDEKAKLVATAGLLDQNDKIRSQIQAEERAKAKEQIALEIEQAKLQLKIERANVLDSLQDEIAVERNQLNSRILELELKLKAEEKGKKEVEEKNKVLSEEVETLELRLADAEVNQETAQLEVDRLTAEQSNHYELIEKVDVLENELTHIMDEKKHMEEKIKSLEKSKKELFNKMMSAFEIERVQMVKSLHMTQQLLGCAANDVIFLTKQNETLQRTLAEALSWEPS